MRSIEEFLNINKQINQGNRTYYLDDKLEHDPTKICPNCTSYKINILHTHNAEGTDYKCRKCNFKYEIIYCTKAQEVGH